MASSGSSENEGLAELLKETLKELRNISSKLGEQSKAIQAMTKTQFQPLSLAAEQPMDSNTTMRRQPIIENELYYNQDKSSHLEDEPQDTTTSEAGSVIAPQFLSADESRISASSAAKDAPDISAAQPTRRLSDSSKINNDPQITAAQSFKRPTTSLTMNSAPDISKIRFLSKSIASSADNSAPLPSAAQPTRESRVSASTESSMQRLGTHGESKAWDRFKRLPYDHRLHLNFESFRDFLSTKDKLQNCDSSLEVIDWVHQQCFFYYNLPRVSSNCSYGRTSQVLTIAPDTDSGRLCTCDGTCYDSSHTPMSPIANVYSRRRKAQLQRQAIGATNALTGSQWGSKQWRRIILLKDISRIYKSIEDLERKVEVEDLLGYHSTGEGFTWESLGDLLPKSDFQQECSRMHGALMACASGSAIVDVKNSDLLLRRSCVTIVGIIGWLQIWSPENWTTVLLTSETTEISMDIYEDGEQAVDREFIVALSGIIDRSTRAVIHHWDVLADYFEKLLSESDTLLEPELHDLLLVDDSKYSKSKKYFWALNILKEIESDIAAVISQLEGFMDFSQNSLLKKYFPLPEGKISTQRERIVKTVLGVLKEDLTRLQSRFSDQRELTKDLRDGLFNASAVMESRASTRLGENSIWSINDSALEHIDIMIGVAVVLGIATYFVVFNVNNIVFLSNQIIKNLKTGAIEHMKKNEDTVWKQRGEGLTEPALANEQNATPSSWRIPQYVWLLAWNWIATIVGYIWSPRRKLFERIAKEKAKQTEQGIEYKPSIIFRNWESKMAPQTTDWAVELVKGRMTTTKEGYEEMDKQMSRMGLKGAYSPANVYPGSPFTPSSKPTPEAVREKARLSSQEILSDWNTLRATVQCCELILHDSTKSGALLDANTPTGVTPDSFIAPEPTASAVTEILLSLSLATISARAPYRLPTNIDFERLREIFAARLSAAEDYIFDLREDPGFFSDTINDWSEHRNDTLLDTNGNPHPTGPHTQDFWSRVVRKIIDDGYSNHETWFILHRQAALSCILLEEYKDETSYNKQLPKECLIAILKLGELLKISAEAPINYLQNIQSSPPIRHHFTCAPQAPGIINMHILPRDEKSPFFHKPWGLLLIL
ncbi:uncharacterized protein Bfra_003963 [Botrytis fragariae]|uniref:Uncharacterized protein n=1 Tax=Botrytis fragariae TaxID=1964551 RepID=A0A8H6AXU8_9HELO|nr:uncharacterized protein Bfra_003963 [Botrytis fragariae]KAF5875509.1 hypothetical protein Bfra_003963 [Botrytis fragariae]